MAINNLIKYFPILSVTQVVTLLNKQDKKGRVLGDMCRVPRVTGDSGVLPRENFKEEHVY
jgi:hypothetical protein